VAVDRGRRHCSRTARSSPPPRRSASPGRSTTRVFPRHAIAACLETAGVTLGQVDHVASCDKPFLKSERLLETYVAVAPRGFRSFRTAMPVWLKEKLFQKSLLVGELKKDAPEPIVCTPEARSAA
jgi:predicted NodU family carbamoyl transferase